MKTFTAKSTSIKKNWYVVNADGKILGRFAANIARFLRGKHKVEYTPHVDIGDYLIIINAKKICVTGNKFTNKIYYHHTGYPGGIKKLTFKEMFSRNPERIIENAVRGMLPKSSLGREMYRKMKIYSGNEHKHEAQNPKYLEFNN